jgi:hypothetical protein
VRAQAVIVVIAVVLHLGGCRSDTVQIDGESGASGTTGDGDGDAGDGDGDPSGDGDGDTGDGDGEPGDGDPAMEDVPICHQIDFATTYAPPQVMLVVDASDSMVSEPNSWDHDLDMATPEVTRWFSLHAVIDTVMTNFGAAMYAGLQRFPSAAACDPYPCYNATACTTETAPEVDIALDNAAAILAALPGPNADSTEINGGSPATKGIVSALDHLMLQPEQLSRYILLITDGAANCNTDLPFPDAIELYDATLPTTVENAYMNEGIPTFVVGIDIQNELVGVGPDGRPEANPRQRLNAVALAGGVPKNMGTSAEKFFNATNQAELLLTLEQILQVIDCTSDLPEVGSDPAQIPFLQFQSDDRIVPGPFDDCANEEGWAWIEVGHTVIFCGSYCDDFKNGASFEGTYGCPPES